MKKLVYTLIAITIIGGAAYGLAQTSLFQGNVYDTGVVLNFSVEGISYDEKNDVFLVKVCTENVDDPSYDSSKAINLTLDANEKSYDTEVVASEGCQEITVEKTAKADFGIDVSLGGIYSVTATMDAKGLHPENDEYDNMLIKDFVFEGDTGAVDIDGDGLTGDQETKYGTDPSLADTDGDTMSDGDEVTAGTDPLKADVVDNDLPPDVDPIQDEPADDDAGITDNDLPPDIDPIQDEPVEDDAGITDKAPVGSLVCSDLDITPDTFMLKGDQDVEFKVSVDLAEETAGVFNPLFQKASLLAFSLPSEDGWSGTLIVESSRTVPGAGEFINPKTGLSSNSVEIAMTDLKTDYSFIYSGGSTGDVLYAYIEDEEKDCSDKLELTGRDTTPVEEDPVEPVEEEEEVLACTSVDIQPDTYTLAADETSIDFTVTVESGSSWLSAVTSFIANVFFNTVNLASENDLAFTLTTDEWTGILVVESSNSSSIFLNDSNGNKSNPVDIAVSGESTTIKMKDKNVAAGDVITAYIEGEENCSDTLTLEAAATDETVADETVTDETVTDETVTDETVADETVADETVADETVTDETVADETVASETVASESVADDEEEDVVADTDSNDWDTILASKSYVCTEPFDDVDESDWFWGKTCRLYRASVFTGKNSDTVDPEGYLTRAEAIKVLMILSGNDGRGDSEHFSDVSSGDWFYKYYMDAEDLGIVHGTSANPNSPITRGDLMLYMARTAEQTLYGWDDSDIPFSDVSKTDYYTYALIIGYNTIVDDPDTGTTRVFNGYSNGTSGATDYIARSEAMTLALRFYLAWYAN